VRNTPSRNMRAAGIGAAVVGSLGKLQTPAGQLEAAFVRPLLFSASALSSDVLLRCTPPDASQP
jgi:hypothetical protein